MTIIVARLRPGLAGELARVAHIFPLPQSDELQAQCGKVFRATDLEILNGIQGMPCENCLLNNAPGDARTRVTRGLPHHLTQAGGTA